MRHVKSTKLKHGRYGTDLNGAKPRRRRGDDRHPEGRGKQKLVDRLYEFYMKWTPGRGDYLNIKMARDVAEWGINAPVEMNFRLRETSVCASASFSFSPCLTLSRLNPAAYTKAFGLFSCVVLRDLLLMHGLKKHR